MSSGIHCIAQRSWLERYRLCEPRLDPEQLRRMGAYQAKEICCHPIGFEFMSGASHYDTYTLRRIKSDENQE